MNSAFENISEIKRNMIIKTCLKEFSIYGYENASTNRIVNSANISKGILFHYFKSKSNLFYYMLNYSQDIIKNNTINELKKITNTDFCDRLKEFIKISVKIGLTYKDEYIIYKSFICSSTLDYNNEIKKLHIRGLQFDNMIYNLYLFQFLNKDIIKTSLEEKILKDYILNLINFLTGKYIELNKNETKDILNFNDLDNYINLLKFGFIE
ncbi:MAG: TetR/AcrR family transcriptional regulator [Clostridiaceae bacterium]